MSCLSLRVNHMLPLPIQAFTLLRSPIHLPSVPALDHPYLHHHIAALPLQISNPTRHRHFPKATSPSLVLVLINHPSRSWWKKLWPPPPPPAPRPPPLLRISAGRHAWNPTRVCKRCLLVSAQRVFLPLSLLPSLHTSRRRAPLNIRKDCHLSQHQSLTARVYNRYTFLTLTPHSLGISFRVPPLRALRKLERLPSRP